MRGLCAAIALAALLAGSSRGAAVVAGDPNAVAGRWLNEEGIAQIEIYEENGQYMGRIVWMKEPRYPADDPKGMGGQQRVDRENPDPRLRTRPLLNLVIMRGFRFDGKNSWSGGRLYDPQNGKEYRGRMTLVSPDALSLRGYVGIPLFGRSERWTRVSRD